MYLMIQKLRIFSAIFMCLTLCMWHKTHALPTLPGDNELSIVDTTSLPEHPRLFMKDADIPEILSCINTDKNLKKLNEIIITKCDEILKLPLRENKMDDARRKLATSREILRRIFYLAYAWRTTGEEKYFQKCKAELLNAATYDTWNPKHFLDIGEMSLAMAIGYDWLYKRLSKGELKTIENALIRKAFDAADIRSVNFFWRAKTNWNQVCCGGLACAAMAIFEASPKRCRELIKRCIKSNAAAQAMYAPDGAYPEGVTYWDYGSSYEALFIAALKDCFGEDFHLSEADGFLDSPFFVLYSRSGTGELFNYADCGSAYRLMPALTWFARESQNSDILFGSDKLIESSADNEIVARLLPMFIIYSPRSGLEHAHAPKEKFKVYGGTTPLMFVKTDWSGEGEYLAAKGGRASSNHAHMDAGSFVFEALGERWAIDLGAHNYSTLEKAGLNIWSSRQDSDRWKVLRYTNFLHNTITVNDSLHNAKGFVPIIDKFNSPEKTGAIFDLTAVFAPALESAKREIALTEGGIARISDDIKTPQESGAKVSWRMCTRAKVKICDDAKCFILFQNGKKLKVSIQDAFGFKPKTWSARPSLACEYKNKGVSVIGFEANIPAGTEASFSVFLEPIKE